jgi:hypothetical protein
LRRRHVDLTAIEILPTSQVFGGSLSPARARRHDG